MKVYIVLMIWKTHEMSVSPGWSIDSRLYLSKPRMVFFLMCVCVEIKNLILKNYYGNAKDQEQQGQSWVDWDEFTSYEDLQRSSNQDSMVLVHR